MQNTKSGWKAGGVFYATRWPLVFLARLCSAIPVFMCVCFVCYLSKQIIIQYIPIVCVSSGNLCTNMTNPRINGFSMSWNSANQSLGTRICGTGVGVEMGWGPWDGKEDTREKDLNWAQNYIIVESGLHLDGADAEPWEVQKKRAYLLFFVEKKS